MTIDHANDLTSSKPLRLWPGVLAVVLLWLLWFVVPIVNPDIYLFALLGGVVCALVVLAWWLFFSRAPWLDRLGAILLMIVGTVATKRLVHPSIAGGGMGNLIYGLAIPLMSLALVAGAAASRRFSSGRRRASMVAAILFACGLLMLVRTGGVLGGSMW